MHYYRSICPGDQLFFLWKETCLLSCPPQCNLGSTGQIELRTLVTNSSPEMLSTMPSSRSLSLPKMFFKTSIFTSFNPRLANFRLTSSSTCFLHGRNVQPRRGERKPCCALSLSPPTNAIRFILSLCSRRVWAKYLNFFSLLRTCSIAGPGSTAAFPVRVWINLELW